MICLVILLASVFVVSAKQDCYSCTSAKDYYTLQTWGWSPYWNQNSNNLKFDGSDDRCDLHPWMLGNGGIYSDCPSLCVKWQFSYTDKNGNTDYATVRGCASDILNGNYPNQEQCPAFVDSSIMGGSVTGTARTCYCNGPLCNPASKTASFGIGALILIAIFAVIFK
uniref:Uncharacterized protein n=1 Tax=Plectus sambesii TaxID=2011161 RepID=A0A914WB60_9BILA